MKYASFVDRIKSQGGEAWNIHFKAVEAKDAGEDVIVLSVGDPDFNTPEVICDTAIDAIRAGDTHYTGTKGRVNLRQKIAEQFNQTATKKIDQNNVIILAGTQNGLYCAASCLLDPGDEVLVIDPSYLTYEATLKATGATVIAVKTDPDNYFELDPIRLRNAVSEKTKAIFFANPNNPTGRVMDRSELEAIAEVAREFDLWVVSDEVYNSLSFAKPCTSIRELEGMEERTVIISSLSKSHAMTGWRCGWMIGNKTLIEHMDPLVLNMMYGLPGFIQEAGATAIEHSERIISDMVETYRKRCAVVKAGLADCPKIKLLEPDAGMFVLIDIRELSISTEKFIWALYEQQKVSTLDASAFGASAQGFIRLSFTLSESELARACQRISQFINDLVSADEIEQSDQLEAEPQQIS
ncbi:pyridoxal phosphate-dependent aminotransferase [Reinekea thalattae]|uniref:pyridoxal phosphate-dependent aminotransferase n=1 Tax=Reinekea thalattae TaxID=2593301 RepID=UPI001C9CD4DD|nr:aminotransferase class I/II-fold pyridoxal phosphate-dependent enzyme [Reinekea thalattae]